MHMHVQPWTIRHHAHHWAIPALSTKSRERNALRVNSQKIKQAG